MTTQNYQNTDVYPRVWGNLIDISTGHTLGLDAGEETTEGVLMWVQPDPEKPAEQAPLPDDFEDLHLKPVAAPAPSPPASSKSTKGATTEPAEVNAAADPKE